MSIKHKARFVQDQIPANDGTTGAFVCNCGASWRAPELHPATIKEARVILFKPSGKYYTGEFWRIPEKCIGPSDMIYSPDFRSVGGGPVLVEGQEPWGYPALLIDRRPSANTHDGSRGVDINVNVNPITLSPEEVAYLRKVLGR